MSFFDLVAERIGGDVASIVADYVNGNNPRYRVFRMDRSRDVANFVTCGSHLTTGMKLTFAVPSDVYNSYAWRNTCLGMSYTAQHLRSQGGVYTIVHTVTRLQIGIACALVYAVIMNKGHEVRVMLCALGTTRRWGGEYWESFDRDTPQTLAKAQWFIPDGSPTPDPLEMYQTSLNHIKCDKYTLFAALLSPGNLDFPLYRKQTYEAEKERFREEFMAPITTRPCENDFCPGVGLGRTDVCFGKSVYLDAVREVGKWCFATSLAAHFAHLPISGALTLALNAMEYGMFQYVHNNPAGVQAIRKERRDYETRVRAKKRKRDAKYDAVLASRDRVREEHGAFMKGLEARGRGIIRTEAVLGKPKRRRTQPSRLGVVTGAAAAAALGSSFSSESDDDSEWSP